MYAFNSFHMQTFEFSGPMTIFAPIDEAFDHLSKEIVGNVTTDPKKLEQLIMYHVVPNRYKGGFLILITLID